MPIRGFFPQAEFGKQKKAVVPLLPQCSLCRLDRGCKSPVMPVAGKGRRKILIAGEAPGRNEDEQNKPFVGASGQLLQRALLKHDIDLFRDCWVLNVVRCRPPKNKLPDKAVDYCRPLLLTALKELQPEVIILLGASPVKSLIGYLWKEDVGPLHRWVGWQIPCQRYNAWVCPTWHPSHLLRREGERDDGMAEMFWDRHLGAAISLQSRPWKKVPDYLSRVTVELDPDRAAVFVQGFIEAGNPVAFDLETDRLKPDPPDAQIISCAVSDGATTIAYPWHGKAVKATRMLLESELPKIAYNLKFESRWLRSKAFTRVRNWVWDGMLAAHVIDNRAGVSGLKFQAFALLGQESYDDRVKPWLKADSANAPNRIKEVELSKLLKYNGADALLEYEVAMRQMKTLGYKL